MLKLNNVCKSYISKSKQEVAALKNVDLEINDSGMVFILGKSGSGKSTLLNILGGLDSATSGEIYVDNQSFADFKQSDYDNYRNQYVGFVFQEFNLLNDFDVAGNVALALRLSKETGITDKVTSALQAVGLSSEFLTRKIDELSGGEKQRVAIARAIVKDSKVILADEHTGNLDSETGESIWNILKDFSKDKLVVVVTHDRESAEKYGDRIIEISDGKIISDSGDQPTNNEEVKAFSPERKRLSNAVCFKMGANNLLKRKAKTVSVVLLSIFTIFVILLTQVLLSFSSEKSLAKFIDDNNVDYIVLTQGKEQYDEFKSYDNILRPSTLKYIAQNANYIKDNVIESKQDILDMGLHFVGEALELDDNSYYLTTKGLEDAYYDRVSYVEIDGESVKLIKEEHPAEFLVGKKVDNGSFRTMDYTLAGVVDTSSCSKLIKDVAFPNYFAKESFNGMHFWSSNQNQGDTHVVMRLGNAKFTDEFCPEDNVSALAASDGKILTERGLQNLDEVTLADDEIALSYSMYQSLFHAGSKWSYVNTYLTEVINTPQQIGQKFALKFFDYDVGELLIDAGELKLVGIVFSYQEYQNDPYHYDNWAVPKFATGANTAKKINIALSNPNILVQVASIKDLQKFLVDFRNKHEGYIEHAGNDDSEYYSQFVYIFEHEIYLFKIIFLAIAGLLSIILILLVINLISFSIVSRKREIGILSALGATNGDITKIFLIETLLISIVTFIINLVAILVSVYVFNNIFCSMVLLPVSLLRFDYITVITLVISSFVLLLLAALIPLRKIIKLKPIDAIKNL